MIYEHTVWLKPNGATRRNARTDLLSARRSARRPEDPIARSASYARDAAHQSTVRHSRSYPSGSGTRSRVHDDDLPARPAGYGCRRRESLRATRDLERCVYRGSVDDSVDNRLKLRERIPLGPALRQCFRWWRGEDLNLRPSGYEPAVRALPCSRLVPCSTADQGLRATFVTSRVAYSRPVRNNTAQFTAPRAMQNDMPRSVTIAGNKRLALRSVGRHKSNRHNFRHK
jgi:hypothetical protein